MKQPRRRRVERRFARAPVNAAVPRARRPECAHVRSSPTPPIRESLRALPAPPLGAGRGRSGRW